MRFYRRLLEKWEMYLEAEIGSPHLHQSQKRRTPFRKERIRAYMQIWGRLIAVLFFCYESPWSILIH